MEHRAYRFEAEVGEGGKLDLTLPLPRGTRVEVLVLAEETDEFEGLRRAAFETMEFWDNPDDDVAWHNL
jgi:hypothetical protein